MSFKPYCLAFTEYGPRPFPVQAFDAFRNKIADCAWAALLESEADEEIFQLYFKRYSWLIKSAHRRGYGLP